MMMMMMIESGLCTLSPTPTTLEEALTSDKIGHLSPARIDACALGGTLLLTIADGWKGVMDRQTLLGPPEWLYSKPRRFHCASVDSTIYLSGPAYLLAAIANRFLALLFPRLMLQFISCSPANGTQFITSCDVAEIGTKCLDFNGFIIVPLCSSSCRPFLWVLCVDGPFIRPERTGIMFTE